MSELSTNISSAGFVGLEPEKMTNEALTKANQLKTENNEPAKERVEQDNSKPQSVLAPAEVDTVIAEMNTVMQTMQRNLSFSVDEQLGEPIISVTDMETDEVIRQIPSEELVVLRKKLDDVVGILFETKV